MFSYVAAALGECDLITEEDSGLLLSKDSLTRRPDLRIQTVSSGEMLVEVKKHYQKNDPFKPWRISESYLKILRDYARTLDLPLKFAVYWQVWNLVDAEQIDNTGSKKCISISDAFMANDMYLLGDTSLGTVPPISFRIYASDAGRVKKNGRDQIKFNVRKACISAGGPN